MVLYDLSAFHGHRILGKYSFELVFVFAKTGTAGVHSVNFGDFFTVSLIIGSQQTNKQTKQDKKNNQVIIEYCRPEESFMVKFVNSPS